MITDAQKDAALLKYHKRGIEKKEVRSYEVSLWTLLDEFITVLKWSDVEQKGRIEEPKIILNIDGTLNFTFKIPMYITYWNENANYAARLEKKENPIWYNTRNGNLIEGMRKVKVIFNKDTENEYVFEFIIIKVTETHEQDMATCEVECEGLAFHELGKVGYKINLSQDNFELDYKEWVEGGMIGEQPIQNLQYWCHEAGLIKWPSDGSTINSRTWYYYVDMDWSSFAFSSSIPRDRHKVYEEPYTASWTTDLAPERIQLYLEKARPVEASQSNLYNITLTIAEQFGVHCRYEYGHDENHQITSRVVVFYNNYNKENEGILGFSYPYSAASVERNVDTTDLTTKLFIEPIESDNNLEGLITIMNSDANKTKEDYILNFDYIHKIGGITDEQYAAITDYEKDIRDVNDELIPVQLKLASFNRRKIEVDAKVTYYENSIDLDQEQIDFNLDIINNILSSGDVSELDSDGYIHITGAAPDSTIIISPEGENSYINLLNTKKGIDASSVEIWRSWIPGLRTCAVPVTGWKPVYDEDYGNLIKIEGVAPTESSKMVYLTYRYKPELYYLNIIDTWKIKLANDTTNKNDYIAQQTKIDLYIAEYEEMLETLKEEKEDLIAEFEHMMGAALREGYWQPEDYKDYGDIRVGEKTFTNQLNLNPFTLHSDNDFVIGWDPTLFDEEDKISYEVGTNLITTYYPCINLSSIFANNSNNIREHISEYSFIFNTNYYDEDADLTDIKYIRSFAIGSEALLKFVKDSSGNIYPALVLVGAKNMSDGSNNSINELAFMKDGTKGHPRLGIISSTLNGGTVDTAITNVIEVHDTSYWIFGSEQINTCSIVYPRINFNTISVKADTTNLAIAYNNHLLIAYEEYQILTRITEYGTDSNPDDSLEYYITIKPEVMWKYGSYTGKISINYVVSNLATSIYVDALEIAKKNSEPKVEYNLKANIINESLINTLYKNMARIIIINDNDLKLENAYGYISEIEMDLDLPQNDTIGIKNYTSKFEDLFSSIVAQTQLLLRESDGISSAIGGNIGLSAPAFSATLAEHSTILNDYLSTYFTSSSTVEDILGSLFTEAGNILGDSKLTLGNNIALSQENAKILGGFASKVALELSPKVTRGTTQPSEFKVGDIFIEVDGQGNEIGRYVATSDSLHSVGGYGFTRTYNGSLALITGASLDIDSENGTVNILAENEIFMGSGGNVKIHADEVVEIVGNKSVNIGGTLINLGSALVAGLNVLGGINIVATAYTNESGPIETGFSDAYTSKVLINPYRIYMAGAKITMVTGTTEQASAVNAIELDGSKGVWIGSDKKISLFASDNNSINANVEISPAHIFFGMNNTNNGNATAAEITEKHIIFAASNAISSLDGDNEDITISNSITGVKITKEKIGLAAASGTNRTAILMSGNGAFIGTSGRDNNNNVVDPETNGSYVSISGAGVIIGSKGTLTVTTTNFIVSPTATGTNAIFYVGTGGVTTSDKYIKYSITNGLEIRGKITANELYIVDNSTATEATLWINAKVTPEAIWLGVVKHTTNNPNATINTSTATSLYMNDSTFKILTGGIFEVQSSNVVINTNATTGQDIFKISNAATVNPINYFRIYNDSGVIKAQLGGWLLTDHRLYNGTTGSSSTNYVALNSDTNIDYAMWSGKEDPDDTFNGTVEVDGVTYDKVTTRGAPFRVTRNGRVYMDYLMLWDSENQCYKEVDFSDFKLAVSLNLKWSGTTITASATYWGKFDCSDTDSIQITGGHGIASGSLGLLGGYECSVILLSTSSKGFDWTGPITITVDCTAPRNQAYQTAVDYVSVPANDTTLDYGESLVIKYPSTGFGNTYTQSSVTITAPSNNYNAGWNACIDACNGAWYWDENGEDAYWRYTIPSKK